VRNGDQTHEAPHRERILCVDDEAAVADLAADQVAAQGMHGFLNVKMGLLGVGVWVLAVHQQFTLAMHGLYGLTLGYGILMLYHGFIILW